MQSAVLPAIEVPKQVLESYHLLIAWVVIIPVENPDGKCDIGLSGGHRLHKASKHGSVFSKIAGFFFGLLLVKYDHNWHGNDSGRVHPELLQHRPNVAVMMDVDHMMHLIEFDGHAEINGDTAEIMHPEPLSHVIHNLHKQARISIDDEIINVQNDCGNGNALIGIVVQEQSFVALYCQQPNPDQQILKSGISNMRGVL